MRKWMMTTSGMLAVMKTGVHRRTSLAEAALAEQERRGGGGNDSDGMSWEEKLLVRSHLPVTVEEQRRQQELRAQ